MSKDTPKDTPKKGKKSEQELAVARKQKVVRAVKNANKWLDRIGKYATSKKIGLSEVNKVNIGKSVEKHYLGFAGALQGISEEEETLEL